MNVHPFRLCLSFIFYFLELIKLGNCCALVKRRKTNFINLIPITRAILSCLLATLSIGLSSKGSYSYNSNEGKKREKKSKKKDSL